MSAATERVSEPLVLGDLAAMDAETPVRWGQVLLRTKAGLRRGPVTAEVFMAPDRSRFRVVDTAGRTEFLSSLQFCRFVLELRSTGRFEFERKPKSNATLLGAEPAKAETGKAEAGKGELGKTELGKAELGKADAMSVFAVQRRPHHLPRDGEH
ncbi:hypothetical protein [Blastochloris sulfoviridis]|uniref:Uncharacterized protein n=1 Tax=Blastochloris sulfoviridis TaxID=50712 RepID=A0A5M6I342_9HYPH|nr:hypothetical protein [Blastochloris sulfoviridis]KAA5602583.1 hypothetical protein F1193_05320 [Blastochloris sulfoviridis]